MYSTGANVSLARAETILSQPVRLKHVADGLQPTISLHMCCTVLAGDFSMV